MAKIDRLDCASDVLALRAALEPFDKFSNTSFADGELCTIRAYVNKIIAGHPGLETPEDHVGWLDAGLCEIDRRLAALSSRTSAGAAGDPVRGEASYELCDCNIGDCVSRYRTCREDRRALRPASQAPAASAGGEGATERESKLLEEALVWKGMYLAAAKNRDDLMVALAPAAQVNPAGREEIARIIVREFWHLTKIPLADFDAAVVRAADAILAARPVAEGDAGDDIVAVRLIPWEPGQQGVEIVMSAGRRILLPLSKDRSEWPEPTPATAPTTQSVGGTV